MSQPPPESRPKRAASTRRRDGWLVFALLLVSYAYFHTGGGPSQNSRYALTRSLARHGRLTIGDYHKETIDKAVVDGRYYSDKAPGLAVLAVPAYWVARALPLPAAPPGAVPELQARLHVTTFLSVGIASALGGAALYWLLRRMGTRRSFALWAAIGWGLGTPAFGYATTFMSHQFAAALLIVSFYLVYAYADGDAPLAACLAAGAAAALAVVSEYPAAVLGLMLFGYAWVKTRRPRAAAAFAAGAAPLLLLALGYNWVCFGAPWRTGYAYEALDAFREGMAEGFMGIGYPSLAVLGELVAGKYRGLLPLSPFVALAVPGFFWMQRRKDLRWEWGLCLATVAYFLLFASGYYMWDGGASMGPRHLVPMLPFAIVPAAFAFDRLRLTAAALLTYSVIACLVSVATFPEFPDVRAEFPFPLRDVAMQLLAEGRLGEKAVLPGGVLEFVHPRFPQHRWDAYNLGQAAGLRGLWSLAPLLAFWGGMAQALAPRPKRKGRKEPGRAAASPPGLDTSPGGG